jgi:formyl-CoA transferase
MTLTNLETTPHFKNLNAPLKDLKVLEMGQLIAGPFAGKTLADFGAQN